ncbi:ATP-binding protein [Glycomyces sp. A-F 0318]|uniref:ATP-binding protein n=1 Tax=Glycomyces amatae TaxID=2881355 RepID=UPI001E622291|nr:ATP-binding protein [Glycomyces amatae]MCD0443959.1 ATP-binding protein [Glycomyces amatae]
MYEAVADLIDNSIDAGADRIEVRFLADDERVRNLLLVDNGNGMDESALDAAMTVGLRRAYRSGSLGKFGAGLKAASLSNASSLTVLSRTAETGGAGRRMEAREYAADFSCGTVDTSFAAALLDRYGHITSPHGTVIRWDRVRAFETVANDGAARYLSEVIDALDTHLELRFHRFITEGLRIDIVLEHADTGEVIEVENCEPLDPFGYRLTGKRGYPTVFRADVEGIGTVELTAHIWPARSRDPGFRRVGPLLGRQGFYFFRHRRLVQAGGWNGYRVAENHLSLARVSINLPEDADEVFRLNVKKDGIVASPAFARGLEAARDDLGRTFRQYLEDAEKAYREGGSRTVQRPARVYPGKGLEPKVRKTVKNEFEELKGQEPISFIWVPLPDDRFFELDREDHVVKLNRRYRDAFNGERRGGLNDAPVMKSLLYLQLEEFFRMNRWEQKRVDQLEYTNTVLLAAVRSQLDWMTR